jgi:hypothetical protein
VFFSLHCQNFSVLFWCILAAFSLLSYCPIYGEHYKGWPEVDAEYTAGVAEEGFGDLGAAESDGDGAVGLQAGLVDGVTFAEGGGCGLGGGGAGVDES